MTPDERAALVERVADIVFDAQCHLAAKPNDVAESLVAIIRAEVLEEAAREMLKQRERWWPDEACAAIRALKGDSNG